MSTRFSSRKLIRLIAATRVVGGVLAHRAWQRGARFRSVPSSRVQGRDLRRWMGRNPLLAGAAAIAAGLLAFTALSVILGAVFVLLGLLVKIALAAGLGLLLYRWLRGPRRALSVVVVPPGAGRP